MKILINASTLKGTGVVQVASSFINECKEIKGNEYIVYLSPKVSANVNKEDFPSNFKFYEFGKNSLYLLLGLQDIFKMKSIEAEEKPDAVFSIFGPSLWRPKAPHLMGFAYPYYVYHDSPIFGILSLKEKIMAKVRELCHMHMLKHDGDYYVCETDDVASRLCDMYNIPQNKVFRAYNTASSVFLNYNGTSVDRNDNEFRFFTLCSPYKHKNMDILNKVIPILDERGLGSKIKFYTTFPKSRYEDIFDISVRDNIVNVGTLSISQCPELVSKCDALFLPTLLECYSASYPEAMCMGKPIVTSNLPFAETVCKEAALYFDPMKPNDIADIICKLVENKEIYNMLITRGKLRLAEFLSAHDRALSYLEICQKISRC